jgi:hypothetical protein
VKIIQGKLGKRLLYGFGIVLMLILVLVRSVDNEHFEQKDYYQNTLEEIKGLTYSNTGSGSVQAGWSKKSIVPEQPVRLTGLRFESYSTLMDSVYVRSFVFQNTDNLVILLSYDLWLIHPDFGAEIKKAIQDRYPAVTGVFLSATHTHSGPGGWGSGLLGKLIMGGSNRELKEFIIEQSLRSVEGALIDVGSAKGAFQKQLTSGMVKNRLDPEQGDTDQWIRGISFEKGERSAVLAAYSAHPVYLSKKANALSADYPGRFINFLEDSVEMGMFVAGTMGSHSPIRNEERSEEAMNEYGRKLALEFLNEMKNSDTIKHLQFFELPVFLPSPQFRISNHLILSPWVFNSIMIQQSPSISILQLGNTIILGLPVELSGEFHRELDQTAQEKGLNLIITTFNGGYLGYAPRTRYYYSLDRPETRSLNWYGPYTGSYFATLIQHILEKIAELESNQDL